MRYYWYAGYDFNRRSFRKYTSSPTSQQVLQSSAQESAVSSRLLEDAIAKKKQKQKSSSGLEKSKLQKTAAARDRPQNI